MCSNCEGYYDDQYPYDREEDYWDPYDPAAPPYRVEVDEDDIDVNEALDLLREAA